MLKSIIERDSQLHLKKLAAFVVVLVLSGFLFYAALPYFGGLVSALILFTLFRPIQSWIVQKTKWSEPLAAVFTMTFSFFVILIPLIMSGIVIGNAIAANLQSFSELQDTNITNLFENDVEVFGFDVISGVVDKVDLQSIISTAADFAQTMTLNALSGLSNFALQLIIAYFILYFLLVDRESLKKFAYSISPFKAKNTTKLLSEFHNQAFANIVGAGINAVIQGAVLALGLWFVGIENALFWGFLGAVLSFLPVVGMPMIWIPASIYLISNGNILSAVFLIIWGGLLITLLDNILRLMINKKIGDIHPIITLMGVLIGLPLFGILGLVLGPLILSYFVLVLGMYKEEYIKD